MIQALTDPSLIEEMQDELLQFKLQKVWTLVDLPYGKRAIRTKWVYRNKKDERGIVIRNKARLFAHGYTQEEGIDYDEVFAPVTRIEAIRLFLACVSFKDFVVYQMDVKSAFLYGKIEEEVYVYQPPGFEDPEFPDRVYKTTSTAMETSKPLLKDAEAEDVDDSPFDLEAYTDSDYAGASLDRKSTTGEYVQMMLETATDEAIQVSTIGLTYYCTLNNGEMEITATIDGKVKTVTEASIRRHLKLEDYDGNTEIFKQLALMGFIQIFLNKHKRVLLPHTRTYIAPAHTQKLFSNMRRASKGYSEVDIPLFPTMLVQGQIVQGEGSTVPVESHHIPTGAPSTSPPQLSPTLKSFIRQKTKVPQPSSPPHTNVTDEAASTRVDVRHGGAAITVTNLDAGQGSGNTDKTLSIPHDSPLPRVMRVVKKLKKTLKTSQARRKARIVVSDDEEDLEDPSKQGRKITEIDQDPDISLVQHDVELVSIAGASVSTASVSTTSPPRAFAAESLVYIRRSASKTKDKGKGIVEESESAITKAKRQQEQERLGLETAVRLQEEFNEEKRQRIARIHEEASSFNFEE
ncbi:retrovirus-related pol polyprotein from transposon TNT 1-94 [Tanacetum coccineum]